MSDERCNEVTVLLAALGRGEQRAADALMTVLYRELHQLARARMQREPAGHTLQPTALVHEAYVRLVADQGAMWRDRRHFFGAAAEAMRRILIERARRVAGPMRGGDRHRLPLEEIDAAAETTPEDLLALDEALLRLEQRDARMAAIVKLRYFAGLSVADTAAALDLSPRTVKREWAVARAWLHGRLSGPDDPAPAGRTSDG
ncbi:MAG: sigma-70 family RNA polymerase sigma factor [Planctomycetes bacterium]|nr:sigma-70 family RNA polymerase sigma factor [Planctomycetota bacterium]